MIIGNDGDWLGSASDCWEHLSMTSTVLREARPRQTWGYPRENLKHGDKSPREVPWMVSAEEDLKLMVKMGREVGQRWDWGKRQSVAKVVRIFSWHVLNIERRRPRLGPQ